MTTSHHPETVTSRAPAPPAPRRPRRRRSGPVSLVRPTAIAVPVLTAAQRQQRRVANEIAAELTAAAREGRRPYCEPGLGMRIAEFTVAADIIAAAAAIAANPLPGALRIGRSLRGQAVAVVLHADAWSLVLRPGHGSRAPASWTVFGGIDDDFGAPMPFCLDWDVTARGVEWTEMLAAVQDLTV